MKRALILILHLFLLPYLCFAQNTAEMSEEAIYAQAELGLQLYEEGDYAQACQSLKLVAESGQLDKPSLGMIAYYLCDSYYGMAEDLEDGSLEKYETMRECYQWMQMVDWKQFKDMDIKAADVRQNVITAYVFAIHFYSGTSEDKEKAISLELEALNLYQAISKNDMTIASIKAHLHQIYLETRQWDESIKMAKDAEKIIITQGGLVSDLAIIYCNLAMIYNQKKEITTSGQYANRVLTCMRDRSEDDLSYDERICYSVALYYLAISYQQIAKPIYYDYFKQAYRLIKITDPMRNERYFRELLLQLVITSRELNDQEYTAKYMEELVALCQEYEDPRGRLYNEVFAYYLEWLAHEREVEQVMEIYQDYLSKNNVNQIISSTEVCDFEEWPMADRTSTFLHILETVIYQYADYMQYAPEQFSDLKSRLQEWPKVDKRAYEMLSFLSYIEGDYKACIAYGQKAFNPDVFHLDQSTFLLQGMTNSARQLKQYKLMEGYNEALFTMDKMLLKRNFNNVTSEVRSNYWSLAESHFVAAISNALVCHSEKSLELAYNASLCRKGVLLSTEVGLSRIVAESRDTCLQRMYQDYLKIHAARNELALKGNESLARYLAEEADKLEAEVIHKAQAYDNMADVFDISWKEISHKLSAKEAAVEFEQYIDEEDELRYVALVIAQGKMHKVDLFSEDELHTLIKNAYKDETLARSLWTPIVSIAPDIQKLYFAPCGMLYNIAIESLPTSSGFISDGLKLIRVSSTRELVRSGRKKKAGTEAVLYGGLQYDMDVDEMVSIEKSQKGLRGALASIDPLPGTLDEVKAIATTLSQSKITPTLFCDTQGTERSVKNQSSQPLRIMHIATHGFYNDHIEDNMSALAGLSPIQRGISNEDFALMRSGLFLAGAENKLMGEDIPQGVDDGMLTAQEISTLDLQGLDLVTLSACETALGDISGDGVFGLQRGFKKAGVHSILMSLWKVDDQATCKLMTEFYSNWIGKKMTKYDALEIAKLTVRETAGWDDPKYWAAFILLDAID